MTNRVGGEEVPRIVVVGATGFTGGLIAHELAKYEDPPMLLLGRDEGKAGALAARVGGTRRAEVDHAATDLTDVAGFRRMLRSGDVVINCAGPFVRYGDPVVRASVEAGCHYLDITGEQAFMIRVQERYHTPAIQSGVSVVNAMAFEYALGTCLATVLLGLGGEAVSEVDLFYRWNMGRNSASTGTRRSIVQVLSEPAMVHEGGERRPSRLGGRRREVAFPGERNRVAISFPAGEVVTLPRHRPLSAVRSWLVSDPATATALRLLGPTLPVVGGLLRGPLEPLLTRGPSGPDEPTRAASEFAILAEGSGGGNQPLRLLLTGADPYGLTAVIATRGALRCLGLADPAGLPATGPVPPPPAGVVDPSQLMDSRTFLDALRPHGVVWR